MNSDGLQCADRKIPRSQNTGSGADFYAQYCRIGGDIGIIIQIRQKACAWQAKNGIRGK
jgi:hypothetical protein